MFGKISTKWLFRSIVFWSILLLLLFISSYLIDVFFSGVYNQYAGQESALAETFFAFTRIQYRISRIITPIASIFLLWHGLDCLYRILMFCQVSRNKEKEEETEKETD